ncbi:MAG: hypothetical protein IPM16_06750 [Chloroflexi bacterium]|nr:hypothetical protein [Chloroflexota bacterium]
MYQHLSHPTDEKHRLPDAEHRTWLTLRLCQMFRGWTWEYAETLLEQRPSVVARIFDAIEVQNTLNGTRADMKLSPFDWWP